MNSTKYIKTQFSPVSLKHLHAAKFISNLGQGAYGIVSLYQCVEEHTPRHKCKKFFAVKQLTPLFSIELGKNIQQNILEDKEYLIMKGLNHTGIRQLYDIDITNNALIYEYVNGIDMFSFLYENKNSKHDFNKLQSGLYMFNQLLNTVEYIHSKGIAHCDLKIENMLIDNYGTVKLIDFGLSERFLINGELIKCIKYQGTLEKISPEIANFRAYDPSKADIWALGIILYNIVYLENPWIKARRSDKNFNLYMNCCSGKNLHDGNLPKEIFGNVDILTNNENKLLLIIFDQLLAISPIQRASIQEIKNNLSKLFESINDRINSYNKKIYN